MEVGSQNCCKQNVALEESVRKAPGYSEIECRSVTNISEIALLLTALTVILHADLGQDIRVEH